MKAAEWKRFVRPRLPVDENWEFRGSLAYRTQAEWVLSGVLGEGSGFDQGVYVWQVTMPLFVPSQVVNLSWSERIGGGARKYCSDDVEALSAALGRAVDPVDSEVIVLAKLLEKATSPAGENPQAAEVLGYCNLLLGNTTSAVSALQRVSEYEASKDWEQDLLKRADKIHELIQNGEKQAAIDVLRKRCRESVAALGLRTKSPSR